MATLDELQPNATVRGILLDCAVTVVNVQWFGSEAHHLIRTLQSGGEGAAAALAARHDAKAETARELAYRLYTVCERKKRAAEALAYNALVQSWPEITRLAREGTGAATAQGGLFGDVDGGAA